MLKPNRWEVYMQFKYMHPKFRPKCIFVSVWILYFKTTNTSKCVFVWGEVLVLSSFSGVFFLSGVSYHLRCLFLSFRVSAAWPWPRGDVVTVGSEALPSECGSESRVPEPWRDRVLLRKTISVDDHLLQESPREHHRLLSRIERGKKKLRNINVSGRDVSYRCQIELSYRYYREFHTGPGYKCALRCLFLAMSCYLLAHILVFKDIS